MGRWVKLSWEARKFVSHSQQTTLLWQIMLILCYADACFSPDFWEYDNRWINMGVLFKVKRKQYMSDSQNDSCWWMIPCLHDTWQYLASTTPISSLRVYSAKTYTFSDFHQHLCIHYRELQLQNLSLTLPKHLKYLLLRKQTLSSRDQIPEVIRITFEILSLCAKKLLSKIGQDDHLRSSECEQRKSSHKWLKVDFDQF